jgi:hypothetical protein
VPTLPLAQNPVTVSAISHCPCHLTVHAVRTGTPPPCRALHERVRELFRDKEAAAADRHALEHEVAALRAQLQSARAGAGEAVSALEEKVQGLMEQRAADASAAEAAAGDAEAVAAELESRLDAKNGRLQGMYARLKDAARYREEAELRLREVGAGLSTKGAKLEAKLEAALVEGDTLRGRLDAAGAASRTLRAERDAAAAAAKTREAELQAALDNLAALLDGEKEDGAAAAARAEALGGKVAALEERLKGLYGVAGGLSQGLQRDAANQEISLQVRLLLPPPPPPVFFLSASGAHSASGVTVSAISRCLRQLTVSTIPLPYCPSCLRHLTVPAASTEAGPF